MRQTLLVALALSTFACAGDDSLAVTGEVRAVVDGTPTGFTFDRRTNLVEADFAEPDDTRLRGSCRIGRDDAGETQVFVAIERAPAAPDGVAIESFSMRVDPEGSGEVEVALGGVTYDASASGTCALALDYAVRSDAIAAVTFDCVVDGGAGATATVAGDLAFEGCAVD